MSPHKYRRINTCVTDSTHKHANVNATFYTVSLSHTHSSLKASIDVLISLLHLWETGFD